MPTFIVQHKTNGKLLLIHKRENGTEVIVVNEADAERVTKAINQINEIKQKSTIVYHEYPGSSPANVVK